MTAIASMPRKKSDWIQPPELRKLIKQNLGYNSRQMSVRADGSNRWIKVTIWDPAVDLAKASAFIESFNTMSDENNDDCFTGQSVDLKIDSAVKEAKAAPFIAEITAKSKEIDARDRGVSLSTGAVLWRESQGFYVQRGNGKRGCYIWESDVLLGTDWAIEALAYQAATI